MALNEYRNFTADSTTKEILQRRHAFFENYGVHNNIFQREALTDTQFLAGDQTYYNQQYGPLFPGRRQDFFFNHIRPVHSLITGHQRNNRKTTTVISQGNTANDYTADQLSKVLMWVHEKDNMYETISDAFSGSCATGLTLLQLYMDYRNDPISGNIKLDLCSFDSFLMDMTFRKKDLSDCAGVWKRSYVTRREAMNLLPEYAEEIAHFPLENRDNYLYFTTDALSFTNKNKISYDEFWYRDYREQTLLIDYKTNSTYEWHGTQERLDEYMSQAENTVIEHTEVPTCKCAIIVAGHCLVNENLTGIDELPFVPCIGYYYPELQNSSSRFQGIVRSLRAPQYLYNRRMILEGDWLEAFPTNGWIYKEGSLVDPESVFKTGSGAGIAVKKNSNIQESLQQIQPTIIPPTTQEYRKDLSGEFPLITGVGQEALGNSDQNLSGLISMLRQRASMVAQEPLFDNLDYAQRLIGNLVMKMVQNNFMPSKVQDIIGDQELSPSFHDHVWGEYNCVVTEGVYTATQKQMQAAQLTDLKNIGIDIPVDVLIDAYPLQNKKELVDRMKQIQEQQAQVAMQRQQIEQQEIASRALLSESRAMADQGLSIERKAEAKKDEEQAVLNMVRALKEIENIDIAQIEKLVFLSKQLSEPVTAGQGTQAMPVQQEMQQPEEQQVPIEEPGQRLPSGLNEELLPKIPKFEKLPTVRLPSGL